MSLNLFVGRYGAASPVRRGSGKRQRRLERGEDFPLIYKNQQHSFYRHVLIEKNYPHHGAVAFGHFGRQLLFALEGLRTVLVFLGDYVFLLKGILKF